MKVEGFNLGNKASRSRGGRSSYLRRRHLPGSMFARHTIIKPVHSIDLAEFIGAMIGDGGITKYQVSIALNLVDDYEYGLYLRELCERLFRLKVTLQVRTNSKCIVLVMSSVELVEYLVQLGLVVGNKVKSSLSVPLWIGRNEEYTKACLRGMFDTDGCIYQEVHRRPQGIYRYHRIAFSSAIPELREAICSCLRQFGWAAKYGSGSNVTLQRFTDIEEYFKIVGSSNPKHLRRFARFGGVA